MLSSLLNLLDLHVESNDQNYLSFCKSITENESDILNTLDNIQRKVGKVQPTVRYIHRCIIIGPMRDMVLFIGKSPLSHSNAIGRYNQQRWNGRPSMLNKCRLKFYLLKKILATRMKNKSIVRI